MPGQLMGAAEVGAMLGVSKQRVQQLVNQPVFPVPYESLAMGKVWLTRDVLKWARETGRGEKADRWEAHSA